MYSRLDEPHPSGTAATLAPSPSFDPSLAVGSIFASNPQLSVERTRTRQPSFVAGKTPPHEIYKKLLTFHNHPKRCKQPWSPENRSTWFAPRVPSHAETRWPSLASLWVDEAPQLVKKWEATKPFVIDKNNMELLRENMARIHNTLEAKGGDEATDEADLAHQVGQALGKLTQLYVSQDWSVSVVPLASNPAPPSDDVNMIQSYFNERPYLLCSKDLYVHVKMPWWERANIPDDAVEFVRDFVNPNPYPGFKSVFRRKLISQTRKILTTPAGWDYPANLETSLWCKEAKPLYAELQDKFTLEPPPAGIPTPDRTSQIEGRTTTKMSLHRWRHIPRPVLVEAPKSHKTFTIAPVELKILGYELKKAAQKAFVAAFFRVPTVSPPWGLGISTDLHHKALLFETLATLEAAKACLDAAQHLLVLVVPGGGEMPSWEGNAQDRLINSFLPFVHARRWLIWTPDMTLRLQTEGLAEPATGKKSTVARWC